MTENKEMDFSDDRFLYKRTETRIIFAAQYCQRQQWPDDITENAALRLTEAFRAIEAAAEIYQNKVSDLAGLLHGVNDD